MEGEGNELAYTIDDFSHVLLANATGPPVVYFCQWMDSWLMGDKVPGPGTLSGQRFQASCLSSSDAAAWAAKCGEQFDEERWLAIRLQEAVKACQPSVDTAVLVILREVLGASISDEDMAASLSEVPAWLKDFAKPT
jgi:hypothetical protein